MEWVVAALVLVLVGAGGAAAVAYRAAPKQAERVVDDGRERLAEWIATRTGGEVTVDTELEPVELLRTLHAGRVPAGRVVVVGGRLPSGLRVRSAEVVVDGHDHPPRWVACVSPQALTRQLDIPGVSVLVQGGRLRVAAGLASVGVRTEVVGGRVRVRIPAALPPFGAAIEEGLSELVPRPPPGLRLEAVEVAGDEVVVRGTADPLLLQRVVADLPRPSTTEVARSAVSGWRAGRRRDEAGS